MKVGELFETSDHQVIRFNFVISKEVKQETKTIFNYFRADYDKMRDCVKSRAWDTVFNSSDIEKNWAFLKTELLTLRDQFVTNRKKIDRKCKWVTREVVRCREAKKKAWNNYVRSGKNRLLYDIYISKLRESVKVNKSAKEQFEHKLAYNIKLDSKSF